MHNRSNVHAALLDATKAFDRINFCKLFRELINRKIPALIMRLLIGMYTNQSMTVRWNGHYSASFGVSNGVKQGGVLSPILFCIYMDNLLVSLKNKGVGCHVGSEFCGAFGYKRVQVIQGFCSSYYGSQLWNLSNKCLEKLYSSWRKSIRKALNIPLRAHSVYIPLLCKCMPLSVQLELRYVKFFMQGLQSKNYTFCFMTRQSSIHISILLVAIVNIYYTSIT